MTAPTDGGVCLSAAVQHHPSRADLLPTLLGQLAPLPTLVVTDPDPDGTPSPWRTYLECLRAMPAEATHLLVVQDDAELCDGFAEAAVAALKARPDRPVAFFVSAAIAEARLDVLQAAKQGRAWAELSPWTVFPCVCSAWPSSLVREIAGWAATNPGLGRCDDGNLAAFLSRRGLRALATVPSLAEHPDVVASTWRAGRPGKLVPARKAALYIGAADTTTIAW